MIIIESEEQLKAAKNGEVQPRAAKNGQKRVY